MIHHFFATVLLPVLLAPQEPTQSHSLDGSQWVLRAREAGREPVNAVIDIVFFRDGRLRSRLFSRRGFPPASYRTWIDGDLIRFEASSTTAVGGTVKWVGAVMEDTVSGTIETADDSIRLINLSFRGLRSPTLEGTRWLATLTSSWHEEGVVRIPEISVRMAFWNGMATTNLQSGGVSYRPAVYELLLEDDEWTIEIQQEGIDGGTRFWTATIDGDRMDGSVRTIRQNGDIATLDVSAVRFPTIEGSWELDLTSTEGGRRDRVTLTIKGSTVETTPVFGERLDPGSYELTWLEGKWRLVITQGDGSSTRQWEASLDDGRLQGRVVQRIGDSESRATITGSLVVDR